MPGIGAMNLLMKVPRPNSLARHELAILGLDRLEIGKIDDVEEVVVDEIVERRLRHPQPSHSTRFRIGSHKRE